MVDAQALNSQGDNLITPSDEQVGLPNNLPEMAIRNRRLSPLGTFSVVLLLVVLQLVMGPRLFLPQGEMGEVELPSRLEYYAEFLIQATAVLTTGITLYRSSRFYRKNMDLVLFLGFVLLRQFLNEKLAPETFGAWNDYVSITGSIVLVAEVCGVAVLHRTMVWFMTWFVITNLAAVVAPQMSYMQASYLAGSYRGLTPQRNILGFIVQIGFVIFLSYRSAPMIFRFTMSALCILLILMTGSVQALLLTMVALFIYLSDTRFGSASFFKSSMIFIVIMMVVAAVFLGDYSLSDIFEVFGRDASMSGRDRIWALAFYQMAREPFWGYGATGFTWTTLSPELLNTFGVATAFFTAHSSYFQVILQYGWMIALIFYFVLARHVFNLFVFPGSFGRNEKVLAKMLSIFCLIGGIIESERLFQPNAGWTCFILAKVFLYYGNQEGRRLQTS